MSWLAEALKAFATLMRDTAALSPRAARGCYSVVFLIAVAAAVLMAVNPGRFWWAPYAVVGAGVLILLLLALGFYLLASDIAAGSGAMGGRTGVMLKDLEEPPPDDRRKRKTPVRRKGDTVPDWKVRPKSEAAAALLDFLAASDAAFDPERLIRWIEATTVRVREAIEDGDLAPVADRLTKHGRGELQTMIDRLKTNRARQVYGKVTPMAVQPVLVDAPPDPGRHAVTALVSLKSRDYVVDARTGESREGNDGEWVVSQEFWSFLRDETRWRLDRIRPAEGADEVLNVVNEVAADLYRQFQRTAPRGVLDHVTSADD